MNNAASPDRGKVYRIEGFTCANCAKTFETNVKQLPGVRDAKVNFGAAKMVVYGEATIEQLEKAGAFENLKVSLENSVREPSQAAEKETRVPFYKKHSRLWHAAIWLVLGYLSLYGNGEEHALTSLFFAISIIVGGYALFKAGFRSLLRLEFDMKTLMTVAITGAVIIGEWAEGAVVVLLFAISEALERFSMDRARQSIRSLMDIAPKEAVVRRNGQELTIAVNDIAVGDIMIVKPGQKIAMDGVVVSGRSAVNQAAITGESVPVEKTVDDEVFAGTINEQGLLEVKATKLVDDTTIAKIIHLVEEAQGERAPSQAFVDAFAKYYTPVIMIAAAFVAVIPPLFGDGSWAKWIYQGLSVLVVGCPCALVISTPISIVTAIGNAAKKGVLIKGGVCLEAMADLKAVAFDKTGTLTKGVPAVTDFYGFGEEISVSQLLPVVAALEYRSEHPLASAIIRKAEADRIPYSDIKVDDFSSITGKGIRGMVDGTTYCVGSPGLFQQMRAAPFSEEQERLIASLQSQGKTAIVVGTDRAVLAVIAVADEARESSRDVIRNLHRMGIQKTVMLTGDNNGTARAIGGLVGVSEVRAELLPQDKLDVIKQLKSVYGNVAMVGDGVNDAPALAASTVGIAMGGVGTDTALETADVVLMGDDLRKLPFTIKLSRNTLRVIKQNITVALAMKLIALLLVIPGWLTLWIAIVSDMGATLLVALNGLRLLSTKE